MAFVCVCVCVRYGARAVLRAVCYKRGARSRCQHTTRTMEVVFGVAPNLANLVFSCVPQIGGWGEWGGGDGVRICHFDASSSARLAQVSAENFVRTTMNGARYP